MTILSSNAMWESFGMRAMPYTMTGGADFGECITTIERVGGGTVDDWYREWMATGERVAGMGRKSEQAGHTVSAREAYFRAATYYHVAYFPLFGTPVDPRLYRAFELEVEIFGKAVALSGAKIEAVEIPFEGKSLPGYFVRGDGEAKRKPTIVHVNGYDANIQEMYFAHGEAAARRGYNCVLFDGPGQGRNLIRDGLTLRPNWETVVSPVIDYVLERPEVDPRRVALSGWSFGGFLAPRAAAFEKRIAALLADPAQWDQRDNLSVLPVNAEVLADLENAKPESFAAFEDFLHSPKAEPMLKWRLLQRGPWVHGTDSLLALAREMAKFELSSVAQNIQCPTFLAAAEGDPISRGAQKLFDALRCPKTLVRFTHAEGSGGHCEALARSLYHQRAFDWLDETLGNSGIPE